jgi:hypothetical protein
MRDPELVARAQHAAARLEAAWERWRALQGLGETPAQPVVGYVGYALKEPWGQPRAVIGFSADEAERLAGLLEHEVANRPADRPPSFTPSRTTGGQQTLVDFGAERSLRSLRASYRVLRVAPASYQEPVEDLHAQGLSRVSFVPAANVWARDGQAPARAQTRNDGQLRSAAREANSTVQYLHRLAAIGTELRHSGQSRSVACLTPCSLSTSLAIGATIRK